MNKIAMSKLAEQNAVLDPGNAGLWTDVANAITEGELFAVGWVLKEINTPEPQSFLAKITS